jgi:integrase
MLETMKKFDERFGGNQLALLSASDIKTWLSRLPLAIKTRNRHLGYIRNAFGLAVKEWKVLAANPLDDVDPFRDPAKKGRKIIKLSPEEMHKFLSAVDKDWLPFFSICAFTGLRCEEVEKLDWSEVKLDRPIIDLPWEKSKNGQRKLEEVPANLLAILTPFAKSEDPVKPKKKLQLARENAARAAGLWPWKQNCIRHSFCSYAVTTKGFTWTSLQSDHSEAILKKHYWEVASKEDAARYWQIVPGE